MPHNAGKSPDEIAERIASIAAKARKEQAALLTADDVESIKADVLDAVSVALDRSLAKFRK